jgi:hypothetical protein
MMLSMDPITGITTALAGLKTATDIATSLRKAFTSHEVKNEEVPDKLMELQGLILESRAALSNAQDDIFAKSKEIHRLEEEARALRANLEKKARGRKHDNAAWKVLEDGTEEGPYCPNCWEKTGNFIQPCAGAVHPDVSFFFCADHGDKNFSFKVPNELCGNKYVQKSARPTPKMTSGWS